MSHQNLTFDAFLDNTQPFVVTPNDYNPYVGNVAQYSSSSGSSYGSDWSASGTHSPNGFPPTSHPRTSASHMTHSAPATQPGYMNHGGYSSYPQASLSHGHRPHTGYQNSHQRSRARSDEDMAYSMLTPPDVQTNNYPPSVPASAGYGRDRRATWDNYSRIQENGTDNLTSGAFSWSPQSTDSQMLGLESPWNGSMSSPPDVQLNMPSLEYNYTLDAPHISSQQSRSVVANALRHVSPNSNGSVSPPASRRSSVEIPAGTGKTCSHCHATSTPLWRREPNTMRPLCNACGLYLQQRNKHRPQELIDADLDDSEESDGDGSGPECSHCHTHHTSVWRRSKTGAQLCNACGVYSRLRGKDRPLSLRRHKIKPRSKHTPATPTPSTPR